MTVWYVNPEGNDELATVMGGRLVPFQHIQAALNHAQPSDEIRVATGVYHEKLTSVRPYVSLVADHGAFPVVEGDVDNYENHHGLTILHHQFVLRGFEVRFVKFGLTVDFAEHVVVEDNYIHHTAEIGLRFRLQSSHGIIRNNVVHDMPFEAIYIGTSPTQRDRYNNGHPDKTLGCIVVGNTAYNCGEGINVKEDAHYTVIKENICHGCTRQPDGAINIQGDDNYVTHNVIYDCRGAGIRVGGGLYSTDPINKPEEQHQYGRSNYFRHNSVSNTDAAPYKWVQARNLQDWDETNK